MIYALKLAQGLLLKEQTKKTPIYLIDDLPAELDKSKREKVANVLASLNAQVFITSAEYSDLEHLAAYSQTAMFHVEHGAISAHQSDTPVEECDSL